MFNRNAQQNAPSGFAMLLKQFGIDPEVIKAQIESFQGDVLTAVKNCNDRLTALEAAAARIETNQMMILALLRPAPGVELIAGNPAESEPDIWPIPAPTPKS